MSKAGLLSLAVIVLLGCIFNYTDSVYCNVRLLIRTLPRYILNFNTENGMIILIYGITYICVESAVKPHQTKLLVSIF